MYPLLPPAVWSMDVPGVSLSTASSMNVQGAPPFTTSRVYSSPLLAVWACRVYVSLFLCQTVQHPYSPVPEQTKRATQDPVRYRKKGTQSGNGMLRYGTERPDNGMPMPAASASMPMLSCDCYSSYWPWPSVSVIRIMTILLHELSQQRRSIGKGQRL